MGRCPSETTLARLGAARSEKERLERAIDAFAKFLGQSRPDSMVSDLLHEPPAPAAVPSPARKPGRWTAGPRPHGRYPPPSTASAAVPPSRRRTSTG
ncbi:hypothetical protein [Streptomyces sp. NPDC056304]|uniref:hypothetical protein n=1 Tax=Streptomyces sp. NPDC056304 TaxID=3345778 RepID=UPI0035DEF7CD